LDNVALSNSPRLGFIEGAVDVSDLMNGEIGGLVRMRQAGAIQDLSVPFTAGQTLSALTYMDKLVEQKTGVTQNIALNPDALQSTTKAAVTASVEAAAGQIEVMVRNLADGMRDLFGLMLRLSHKNMDEERMMRLNGMFVPVNPKVWDLHMDITVNVGLGTGREDERVAALQQALQLQTQVYQSYGPQNGLVSLTNIRNTLTDMMATAGVRNSDRYFAPINQEIEAQMLAMQQQQQAQLAGQQQDPNAAYLQAEQMKAQAKVSTDMAKLQLDAQKSMAEDDRERDKMAQDLLVDAAKIAGQYGTQVDIARVKAEQDKMRTVAGIAQSGQ
jgi:3-dehydroquinate dehydratase